MWDKVKAKFKSIIGTSTVTVNVGWVVLAAVVFLMLLGIAIGK